MVEKVGGGTHLRGLRVEWGRRRVTENNRVTRNCCSAGCCVRGDDPDLREPFLHFFVRFLNDGSQTNVHCICSSAVPSSLKRVHLLFSWTIRRRCCVKTLRLWWQVRILWREQQQDVCQNSWCGLALNLA